MHRARGHLRGPGRPDAGRGRRSPRARTRSALATLALLPALLPAAGCSHGSAVPDGGKGGAALVTVARTGDTVTSYLAMKAKGGFGTVPLEVAREEDLKLRAALAARR